MGVLEKRIVEDIEALIEGGDGCEGGMLVFPLGLMAALSLGSEESGPRIVRRGQVAMLCRPEEA